jgi:hypothetical protein
MKIIKNGPCPGGFRKASCSFHAASENPPTALQRFVEKLITLKQMGGAKSKKF